MTVGTGFDYYYGDESNQFSFYRVPRQLVTGERFKRLSTDAKLLVELDSGKPNSRELVWQDIDTALSRAYTMDTFWHELKQMDYKIKHGPNIKHSAVRPAWGGSNFRLDSMGEGYTEAELQECLAAIRSGKAPPPRTTVSPPPLASQLLTPSRRYRVRGGLPRHPPRKLRGFRALYFKYLYLLAAFLLALSQDNKKLSGKTSMSRLLRDGKELKVFQIKEVCSVNPSITLQDAEFKIMYADRTLISDSNGIYRTNENGEIRIEGLKPGKSVVVTEARAPAGFLFDTQSQTIRIKEGRAVSLTFKKQPKGKLIIQKRDSITGQPLPGAEFRVTHCGRL